MTTIAIDRGRTIDKFVGAAMMVFSGDPSTEGEARDALICAEMPVRMRKRVHELCDHWRRFGVPHGVNIRMGITTGYSTVRNFGPNQRLDYTALGSPVNIAAGLQGLAPSNEAVVADATKRILVEQVEFECFDEITPKGFSHLGYLYLVKGFMSNDHRDRRQRLSHGGKHVEINVFDTTDIRAVIKELQQVAKEIESRIEDPTALSPKPIALYVANAAARKLSDVSGNRRGRTPVAR